MNFYWVFTVASTLFFLAESARSLTVSPSIHLLSLQSTLLVLIDIHSSIARHLSGQESAEALEQFRRTLHAPTGTPTDNPVHSVVDLYHREESNFHYQKHLDHLKQYQFHNTLLKNRGGDVPKMAVTKKLQTHQQRLFPESLTSHHQHDHHESVKVPEVSTPDKELSDLEKSLELLHLIGDFSSRDDTPSVPSTDRHVGQPTDLACQDFICLLAKYDLLKTDKGYVLTADERPRPNITAGCSDFACWMNQFIVRKKTYGFELVHKDLLASDLGAQQSKADQNEADFAKIFQLGSPSLSVASTPKPVITPLKTVPVPELEDYSEEGFWSLFGQAQSSPLIPERAPSKAKTPPQTVGQPYKVDYGSLFGDDYDYSGNY